MDDRRRHLERAAADDPQAAGQLFVERCRRGEIHESSITLAAFAGYSPARQYLVAFGARDEGQIEPDIENLMIQITLVWGPRAAVWAIGGALEYVLASIRRALADMAEEDLDELSGSAAPLLINESHLLSSMRACVDSALMWANIGDGTELEAAYEAIYQCTARADMWGDALISGLTNSAHDLVRIARAGAGQITPGSADYPACATTAMRAATNALGSLERNMTREALEARRSLAAACGLPPPGEHTDIGANARRKAIREAKAGLLKGALLGMQLKPLSTEMNVAGSMTGRMSSRRSNMQNMPIRTNDD